MIIEENALTLGFGDAALQLPGSFRLVEVIAGRTGLPDKLVELGPRGLLCSMFNPDPEGIARRISSSFAELANGGDIKQ